MPDQGVNLTDEELRAALLEGWLDDPATLNRIDSDSRRRLARVRAESAAPDPSLDPDLSQESAPVRFMGGVAKVLNPVPFAQSLKTDPSGTLRGMWDAQVEQFQKGNAASMDALGMVERVGRYAAGALPILGPAAAHAGDTIAGGDMAGGLGEAAGLLGPIAGPGAARAGVRALPEGVAAAADASATRRMTEVIAPKVGRQKLRWNNQAEKVAPSLAREPGMGAFTREGLARKVGSKFDAASDALDVATDARLVSQQVQTGPLVQALDEAIGELTAQPVEAMKVPRRGEIGIEPGEGSGRPIVKAEPYGKSVEPEPNAGQIGALRKIRNELAALGETAPYEAVRTIRQAWDHVADVKYAPSVTQDFLTKQGEATGALKGTGAMRDALAKTSPETAAANADFSLRKAERDLLDATRETEQARPHVGRSTLMRVGGALAGGGQAGPSGALGGLVIGEIADRIAGSGVTTKIYTARLLAQLADAVRGNRPSQVASLKVKLARTVGQGAGAAGGQSLPRVARDPVEEDRRAGR